MIESAAQYCEAIENNTLIREYSTQLARSITAARNNNESINISNFRERALDNRDGKITQSISAFLDVTPLDRVCYKGSKCFDVEKKVKRWAGNCAANHINDELLYFFIDNFSTTSLTRSIEEAKNTPDYSIHLQTGSRLWGTLIAIAYPNGINALEASGKQNVEEFRAYLDTLIKEHEESDKAAAEEARQNAIKKKADSEFANSPNGKLTNAYQSMAAINQCVDAREGYAMVYINDVQHKKAKKMMRQIETALKNKLQGTTADALWKKTAPSVNIQELFIQHKFWTGANEIQVCQGFIQNLDVIGEGVLGKNVPAKSW